MIIYKYSLPVVGIATIPMPAGAKILSVGSTYNNTCPCLWALVDLENQTVVHRFRTCWTGVAIDNPGDYIGTVSLHSEELMCHVFDMGEEVIGDLT